MFPSVPLSPRAQSVSGSVSAPLSLSLSLLSANMASERVEEGRGGEGRRERRRRTERGSIEQLSVGHSLIALGFFAQSRPASLSPSLSDRVRRVVWWSMNRSERGGGAGGRAKGFCPANCQSSGRKMSRSFSTALPLFSSAAHSLYHRIPRRLTQHNTTALRVCTFSTLRLDRHGVA